MVAATPHPSRFATMMMMTLPQWYRVGEENLFKNKSNSTFFFLAKFRAAIGLFFLLVIIDKTVVPYILLECAFCVKLVHSKRGSTSSSSSSSSSSSRDDKIVVNICKKSIFFLWFSFFNLFRKLCCETCRKFTYILPLLLTSLLPLILVGWGRGKRERTKDKNEKEDDGSAVHRSPCSEESSESALQFFSCVFPFFHAYSLSGKKLGRIFFSERKKRSTPYYSSQMKMERKGEIKKHVMMEQM